MLAGGGGGGGSLLTLFIAVDLIQTGSETCREFVLIFVVFLSFLAFLGLQSVGWVGGWGGGGGGVAIFLATFYIFVTQTAIDKNRYDFYFIFEWILTFGCGDVIKFGPFMCTSVQQTFMNKPE